MGDGLRNDGLRVAGTDINPYIDPSDPAELTLRERAEHARRGEPEDRARLLADGHSAQDVDSIMALAWWNRTQTPTVADVARRQIRQGARLLRAAHALGVEVRGRWLPGGEPTPFWDGRPRRALAIRDPAGALTAEMRRELLDTQGEVLLCLAVGPASLLTLREFNASGRVLRVWSDVLGEEVLVAADTADPCHPLLRKSGGRVAYRAGEILGLLGEDAGVLRARHEVKKVAARGDA